MIENTLLIYWFLLNINVKNSDIHAIVKECVKHNFYTPQVFWNLEIPRERLVSTYHQAVKLWKSKHSDETEFLRLKFHIFTSPVEKMSSAWIRRFRVLELLSDM